MNKRGKLIIPAGVSPWAHEERVAKILANAGHVVEFIPATATAKRPDVMLDGIEFEIKSPITNNPKKITRNLKRALEQSQNIIIDSSRIKNMRDDNLRRLLIVGARNQKIIKRLIFITKRGQIIDLTSEIR